LFLINFKEFKNRKAGAVFLEQAPAYILPPLMKGEALLFPWPWVPVNARFFSNQCSRA